MSSTIIDLVTGALTEIKVARAGDVLSAEDAQLGLDTLNELLDYWNAESRAVYANRFADFTLVPGTSPHTIGVAGSALAATNPNFVVTGVRPVEILFAAINLGGSPPVYEPVNIRDDAWYANNGMPNYSASVPTDLYYEPDWSDPDASGLAYGACYFVGVPSVAYGVRLWLRTLFAQAALTDIFSQPPGYKRALRMTLAEWCASAFGQTWTPMQAQQARDARATVWGNNVVIPKARPKDCTMSDSRNGTYFNYRNRSFTGS